MMPKPADIGLEGEFQMRLGRAADYHRLARFHYTRYPPATFALVVSVDHVTSPWTRHSVGVGVLSNPSLSCKEREEAMSLGKVPREWKWAYLNTHLRTISRIIVHPQYRGIGLSAEIVRFLLRQAPTRYVEAISKLASHHPLFERAGMKCVTMGDEERPAYFLVDRVGSVTVDR